MLFRCIPYTLFFLSIGALAAPPSFQEAAAEKAQRKPASSTATIDGPPPSTLRPRPTIRDIRLTRDRRQPGFAISVVASIEATAFRFADSLAAINSAPWHPISEARLFRPNGMLPAQVVVQVGTPVGPATQGMSGPFVRSKPQAKPLPGGHGSRLSRPSYDFHNRGKSYENVRLFFSFRLDGLGENVGDVRIDNASICGNDFVVSAPPMFAPAGWLISQDRVVVGGLFNRAIDSCRIRFRLLAEGGNFAPGQSIVIDETIAVDVARRPLLSLDRDYAHLFYRPRLALSYPQSPGCSKPRFRNGKLTLTVTSGVVPADCHYDSEALFLPDAVSNYRLHWKLIEQPASSQGGFHCQLGGSRWTRYGDATRPDFNSYQAKIRPTVSDYVHATTEANPAWADTVLLEAEGEDLDRAGVLRRWLKPLRVRLTCDPYVGSSGHNKPGVDRLHLVLDRVEYRAPPRPLWDHRSKWVRSERVWRPEDLAPPG